MTQKFTNREAYLKCEDHDLKKAYKFSMYDYTLNSSKRLLSFRCRVHSRLIPSISSFRREKIDSGKLMSPAPRKAICILFSSFLEHRLVYESTILPFVPTSAQRGGPRPSLILKDR